MKIPTRMESTATLLSLVCQGDDHARERLCRLYLPILRRWAHGRLPCHARSMAETDDLVQLTFIQALDHISSFTPVREGAFLAYLRRILLNALRDELRKVSRTPHLDPLESSTPDPGVSPVDHVVGAETMQAYETGLEQLSEPQREAVILRVEFGYSYPEIAAALELNSEDSARMTVTRAISKLAQVMI